MSVGRLDFLFDPRSVAVVGASPTPGKISHIIMESLEGSGYRGEVYPVNPKYTTVRGLRCYPSLREIGKPVDLAILAIPAQEVVDVVKDGEGVVKGCIVISGGFGEKDERGRLLERELRMLSSRSGIRIVGPNCMGVFDAVTGLDTFFIPRDRVKRPGRGRLSILSQSGSFALTAIDELASEGIGVARVVSYGNRLDVNETDCLEFLAEDDATGAVAIYIESVDDGRRFIDVARRCAMKKPVMAIKVGRTAPGITAAGSHTGAMAGRYEIYRTAFKKASIIELRGFEDFIDGCKALGRYDPPKGNRVVIITDGGGVGVNIADACCELGLKVPSLEEDLKKRIEKEFPPFFIVGNPLDLTGSVTDELFAKAVERTLRNKRFDMAIVAALWGPPGLTDRLPEILARKARAIKKPVIICSPGGEYARKKRALFRKYGFPVFTTPESSARAGWVLSKTSQRGGRRRS